MKKYIKKFTKSFSKIDKPLFLVILIALVFGVLMVGSASSLKSYMKYGTSFHFFMNQLIFALLSLIPTFLIFIVPIKKWKNWIYFAVLIIFSALVYVLFSGKVNNGISGWINIFGFGIQPSEFAKTAVILLFAVVFEKFMRVKYVGKVTMFLPFIVPIIYMMLIFMQPDLGTLVILLGITVVLFLIIPYERKSKLIISALSIGFVFITVITMLISGKGLNEMQKNRLKYREPCTRYREETGYQVCNGYIAINSGGLFGSGPGNSKQKYLYLPEAHTDFIFPIVIEEFGLVVGAVIFLVYFIIIFRILTIAKKSYNLQGSIICYGVATYISLHIMINIGGVLGLIPLTGVPLPFLSYGGSFLINLLICLAFVQRVNIENVEFEQKHIVK